MRTGYRMLSWFKMQTAKLSIKCRLRSKQHLCILHMYFSLCHAIAFPIVTWSGSLSLKVDKLTKGKIYVRWLFKVLHTICWLLAKLSGIVLGIKGGLLGFIFCFSVLFNWGLISLSSVLISCFVWLFNLCPSSRISLDALSFAFASTNSFSSHVGLK